MRAGQVVAVTMSRRHEPSGGGASSSLATSSLEDVENEAKHMDQQERERQVNEQTLFQLARKRRRRRRQRQHHNMIEEESRHESDQDEYDIAALESIDIQSNDNNNIITTSNNNIQNTSDNLNEQQVYDQYQATHDIYSNTLSTPATANTTLYTTPANQYTVESPTDNDQNIQDIVQSEQKFPSYPATSAVEMKSTRSNSSQLPTEDTQSQPTNSSPLNGSRQTRYGSIESDEEDELKKQNKTHQRNKLSSSVNHQMSKDKSTPLLSDVTHSLTSPPLPTSSASPTQTSPSSPSLPSGISLRKKLINHTTKKDLLNKTSRLNQLKLFSELDAWPGVDQVRRLFRLFDSDGDGVISPIELRLGLSALGFESEIKELPSTAGLQSLIRAAQLSQKKVTPIRQNTSHELKRLPSTVDLHKKVSHSTNTDTSNQGNTQMISESAARSASQANLGTTSPTPPSNSSTPNPPTTSTPVLTAKAKKQDEKEIAKLQKLLDGESSLDKHSLNNSSASLDRGLTEADFVNCFRHLSRQKLSQQLSLFKQAQQRQLGLSPSQSTYSPPSAAAQETSSVPTSISDATLSIVDLVMPDEETKAAMVAAGNNQNNYSSQTTNEDDASNSNSPYHFSFRPISISTHPDALLTELDRPFNLPTTTSATTDSATISNKYHCVRWIDVNGYNPFVLSLLASHFNLPQHALDFDALMEEQTDYEFWPSEQQEETSNPGANPSSSSSNTTENQSFNPAHPAKGVLKLAVHSLALSNSPVNYSYSHEAADSTYEAEDKGPAPRSVCPCPSFFRSNDDEEGQYEQENPDVFFWDEKNASKRARNFRVSAARSLKLVSSDQYFKHRPRLNMSPVHILVVNEHTVITVRKKYKSKKDTNKHSGWLSSLFRHPQHQSMNIADDKDKRDPDDVWFDLRQLLQVGDDQLDNKHSQPQLELILMM